MRIVIRILIVVAVIAAAAVFLRGGMTQTRRAVMHWCANALTEALNERVTAEFAFEELHYTWPAHLELRRVTLTEDGVEVASMKSVAITLKDVPQVGKVFVIDEIEVTDPRLSLRPSAEGDGWAGFSPFLRAPTDPPPAPPPGMKGEAPPLSEVLALRTLLVHDGSFEVHEGDQVWSLDGIDVDCTGGPDADGWNKMHIVLKRDALLTGVIDGRVQIDKGDTELTKFNVEVALTKEARDHVAPPLSTWLKANDVVGDLKIDVTGSWSLSDWTAGTMDVAVNASGLNSNAAGIRWPIRSVAGDIQLEQRRFVTDGLQLAGLGGTASLSGSVETQDDWTYAIVLATSGMRLERLRLGPGDADDGGLMGQVDVTGHLNGAIVGDTDLTGTGSMKLSHGRIATMPLFDQLADLLNVGAKDRSGRDYGDANWSWDPSGLRLTDARVIGASIAARGEGEFGTDGRMNLRLNAGPIEKLEESTGLIGEIFGALTDALVKYQVTGTYEKPVIEVRPFGIGAEPTP